MTGTEIYSDTFPAFGGSCDLVFTGLDADKAKSVLQVLKNETEQLENVIGSGSFVSDLRKINVSPAGEWIPTDYLFLDFLKLSQDFYSISNGAFDVTIGALYDLWEKTNSPEFDQIEEARKNCGFELLELDTEHDRVRLLQEGVKLDFRMLKKAFAIDVLKERLIENGVENGIVSFDEEVILALGVHPSGDSWPIGIRNLQDPEDFLHVFENSDRCIVTAGTVYADPELNIVRDRIVISPESGLPVEGKKTVSVSGKSASFCAFLAHVWLILPENDKNILADQISDFEIFEAEYLVDDIKTKLTILNDEEDFES